MASILLPCRLLLGAFAATLVVASAWGQQAKVGDESVIEGIAFMRAAVPPQILQDAMAYKQAASGNDPVMERSASREIRDFRDFLDRTVAHERSPVRKLELVNAYVNAHARQIPDETLYLRNDFWAPPLNTLLVGGDCEDFVLLKAWALKRVGFDPRDVYMVGGVSRTTGQPIFHAVLVVIFRPDRGVLLDSLSNPLYSTKEAAKFEPIYALNRFGYWRVEQPNPADRRYLDDLARQSEPIRLTPPAAVPPR